MNYTKETYNKSAKRYEKENQTFTEEKLSKERNLFLKSLKGKKILDLGSGPGTESLWFKKNNLNPICVDFSEEMIKLCKEKGLTAICQDMRHLDLEDQSFYGIWAYTSLIHLEKK